MSNEVLRELNKLQFDSVLNSSNVLKTFRPIVPSVNIWQSDTIRKLFIKQNSSVQVARRVSEMTGFDRLYELKGINPNLGSVNFEDFCRKLFYALGFIQAGDEGLKPTGDGGVDGSFYYGLSDGSKEKIVLQLKLYDYKNFVNLREVRKFVDDMAKFHADKGLFITTSEFYGSVYDFASNYSNLYLINGFHFGMCLKNLGLTAQDVQKYRHGQLTNFSLKKTINLDKLLNQGRSC